MQGKPPRSSLPLQILLSANAYYFALFFLGEVALLVYKNEILPYSDSMLALDVILLLILGALEILWIFLGGNGNLSEQPGTLIFSLITLVIAMVGVLYYIFWQTYVMPIDEIICGILLGIHGFQIIFSLVALSSFTR
uniref:Transmembrane protein 216-like n=1 Tax=Phallusia mammillata TaxID=59560 RepID=A0A6F9DVM9_9ASCI|nr:transmembrane protein 216-like [Phallusia mammillata]